MTEAEAVAALDALTSGDQEGDHIAADEILLAAVPPAVKAAYGRARARARAGGFWYA
jgi:hypothetical protein